MIGLRLSASYPLLTASQTFNTCNAKWKNNKNHLVNHTGTNLYFKIRHRQAL